MRLGVLGLLTLDGTSDFGRRDRAVLTALAIYVGRSLSADQLADAVWGADQPPSFHKALQGCVVRLRKALGADAIGTSAQGYRLNMAADEIDSHRFEQMVVRSRELLTLGEPERAAFRLTEALELWRGRAFEDVESWDSAIIGTAGEVIVLDVESGEPVGPQVVGHAAGGWGMDYSPDGSRIFTTGLDGGVSLWDGTTGELLGTVVLPEQTVANAAFGDDGHTVVMSTDYESVYIWDTRVEYALDYACRLAGRDFTRAEWQENFGERAYEETCPAV